MEVQGPGKMWSPGLVNFVSAVAYLFCLNLPAAFSQAGDHNFASPCIFNPLMGHDVKAKLKDETRKERFSFNVIIEVSQVQGPQISPCALREVY